MSLRLSEEQMHIIFNSPQYKNTAIKLIKAALQVKYQGPDLATFGNYQLWKLLNVSGDGWAPSYYTDFLLDLLIRTQELGVGKELFEHDPEQHNPLDVLKSMITFFRALENIPDDRYNHWLDYMALGPYGTPTADQLNEMIAVYDISAAAILSTSQA